MFPWESDTHSRILAAERENVQRYADAFAMHKAAHDKLKAVG
jgi:hypothetical protein